MKTTLKLFLLLPVIIFITLPVAGQNKAVKNNLNSSFSTDYTKINSGNVSTLIFNTGIADISSDGKRGGYEFPKGSGKTAFFSSGFMWGGKVSGQLRVGGSNYLSGLQPGKIPDPGTSQAYSPSDTRIYRVRSDYKTSSFAEEIVDEKRTYEDIFAQYEKDWQEWPASQGAPYTDLNFNDVYDPDTDIPGIAGANQTIWYVANDLDASLTQQFSGTDPIGIELQVTVWNYTGKEDLSDLIFKKYRLINKKSAVDSMYISIWADPDIGSAIDDYAGCDTLLNLAYGYNALNYDDIYGSNVPAVGFGLLQGPLVPASPSDTATFAGGILTGKRNLPMTAFYYLSCCNGDYSEPEIGTYTGALQYYNFFRGRYGATGSSFQSPEKILTAYAVPGSC